MTSHTSTDLLIAEISELERQLRLKKNALKELRKAAPVDRSRYPFYGMAPRDAAKTVLQDAGAPMELQALHHALVAGGITIGQKRAEHNVRIGLNTNLRRGNLVEMDGLIGLPEWAKKEK
ncbi:MAG TPA: hypothetical protein VHZ09_17625 [Acidobacteriaceae bacterium]|jgi:hypothetical protein|nr:hypothetical protein [Acidobacteriaceae bacterium]